MDIVILGLVFLIFLMFCLIAEVVYEDYETWIKDIKEKAIPNTTAFGKPFVYFALICLFIGKFFWFMIFTFNKIMDVPLKIIARKMKEVFRFLFIKKTV